MDQFQCTIDTDALALFDGQRVISFFQFDSRTNATVAQVDQCLEVKRFRIHGQARTEPTKKWADMASRGIVVVFLPDEKIVFLQRHPYAPCKDVVRSSKRYFQAAMNEKEAVRNDATVRVEEHIGFAFVDRDIPIRRWPVSVKRWNAIVVSSTVYAAV